MITTEKRKLRNDLLLISDFLNKINNQLSTILILISSPIFSLCLFVCFWPTFSNDKVLAIFLLLSNFFDSCKFFGLYIKSSFFFFWPCASKLPKITKVCLLKKGHYKPTVSSSQQLWQVRNEKIKSRKSPWGISSLKISPQSHVQAESLFGLILSFPRIRSKRMLLCYRK